MDANGRRSTPMLKRAGEQDSGERGQALILFVAIFSVILAMGAVALDQGLAYGRHGQAQNVADAASRAGAWGCLGSLSGGASAGSACSGAAETAVVDNAQSNLSNAADVTPVPSGDCNGTNGMPSMQVVVQRQSPALFLQDFGQPGFTASAGATACVGEVSRLTSGSTMDMIPLWLAQPSDNSRSSDPNRQNCGAGGGSNTLAGQQCVIFSTEDLGRQPSFGPYYDPSGDCGPTSSAGIAGAIQNGISTFDCTAGDGLSTSSSHAGILDAFEARLPASGEPCGGGHDVAGGLQAAVQKLDGSDASPEGVGGRDDPATVYRQQTCVSPRLVLIPLVAGGATVQGFAAVYIEGCWTDAVGAPDPRRDQLNECDSDDRGTNDLPGPPGRGPHTNTRVWGVVLRVYLPGSEVKTIDSINNNGSGIDGAAALAIQTTR